MKKSILTLVAAALTLGSFTAKAVDVGDPTVIASNISASTTWVSSNVYVLQNNVYVTNNATLTIEPGTLIQGLPDDDVTSTAADNPGALIITQGATLNAVGTASNPITFTKLNDNKPFTSAKTFQAEQWGGLIILGNTYIARDTTDGTDASWPSSFTVNTIEGLVTDGRGDYGGTNDDDDSGDISYVRVRYGGFELGAANEINGVTLGAVGRGTNMDHVEVFGNKDDGFEFFGGTVNSKYLVVANIGDDSFDFDEGFRGKGQFWFTLQGEVLAANASQDKGDKFGEMDGSTGGDNKVDGDSNHPYGIPVIYNATGVGLGVGFAGTTVNSALHFRDNIGGQWRKGLFYDFDGAAIMIEGNAADSTTVGDAESARRANQLASDLTDDNIIDGTNYASIYPGGSVPAFYPHLAGSGGNQLEVVDSMFIGFEEDIVDSDVALHDPELFGASGGDGTKGAFDNGAFTNASLDNSFTASNATSPFVAFTRSDVSGAASLGLIQVTSIDPRPTSATLSANPDPASSAPADGFFTPVTYPGAFSSTTNWAEGWTTLDEQGYFANTGSNPVDPASVGTDLLFAVSFATTSGATYTVSASDSPSGPFSPIATVDGDGTTVTYVDTRALATRQFYEVTAQ